MHCDGGGGLPHRPGPRATPAVLQTGGNAPFLTTFNTFLVSFSLASGCAMADTCRAGPSSSDMCASRTPACLRTAPGPIAMKAQATHTCERRNRGACCGQNDTVSRHALVARRY